MKIYKLHKSHPVRRESIRKTIEEKVNRLFEKGKIALIRRSAIRELSRLRDAQLEDIGVPRYAIRDVVNAAISANLSNRKKATVEPFITETPRVNITQKKAA